MSKLRCSLTNENLERNMLAWKMMQNAANDATQATGGCTAVGCLDDVVDQLADELGTAVFADPVLDVIDVDDEGADGTATGAGTPELEFAASDEEVD